MRRPHRTAAKNVYDQAAWPSLTLIQCAVGIVAGYARRVSNRSSVLSFWPHPATVSVRKRVIRGQESLANV